MILSFAEYVILVDGLEEEVWEVRKGMRRMFAIVNQWSIFILEHNHTIKGLLLRVY